MKYQLVATCVGSSYEDITAFDESSRDITYETARRYVNMRALEEQLGYPPRGWIRDALGYPRPSLTLKKDYSVSYAKGIFRGQPCVVVFWSDIHHFFVPMGG